MIKGTEFWRPEFSPEQMYFCPTIIQEKDSEPRNCFIRQNFEKNDPLQCSLEPIPKIESHNIECGAGKNGKLYGVFYEVTFSFDTSIL